MAPPGTAQSQPYPREPAQPRGLPTQEEPPATHGTGAGAPSGDVKRRPEHPCNMPSTRERADTAGDIQGPGAWLFSSFLPTRIFSRPSPLCTSSFLLSGPPLLKDTTCPPLAHHRPAGAPSLLSVWHPASDGHVHPLTPSLLAPPRLECPPTRCPPRGLPRGSAVTLLAPRSSHVASQRGLCSGSPLSNVPAELVFGPSQPRPGQPLLRL